MQDVGADRFEGNFAIRSLDHLLRGFQWVGRCFDWLRMRGAQGNQEKKGQNDGSKHHTRDTLCQEDSGWQEGVSMHRVH